jgi:uncharacterized membrane protein
MPPSYEVFLLPITVVILLLILAIPLIFIYLFLRLSETALEVVGLDHWQSSIAILGSVLFGFIDIPLNATPLYIYPDWFASLSILFLKEVPAGFFPVYLAVNLGGCIIPLIISAHIALKGRVSISKALIGVLLVAVITYNMAKAIPGEGITVPFWLPPTLAAICGLLLARGFRKAAPLAYISGTLGTLIGADIMMILTPGVLAMLSPLRIQIKPIVISIGGAGVFDGIFLTSIVSVFLAVGIAALISPPQIKTAEK